MSTVDPIGDGGGGGTSTSVDDNATPGTPSTDIAVPPGSQHHQHPPPSPLSGCYLLVVLPEPHTAQHRDLILNRLAKGFLSWDKDSCHVDLEKELQALVAQAPEGEEARNGERLIQYATENLVTEVLIHPQTNTLLQCIRNLLASFTKHRHIIHAGYTFAGNGSWILQDGTFSLADFLDAFSEHEVQRVLRAYENSVTVDINCAGVGEWSTSRLSKEACTRSCRVRLNPDDVLTAGVPAIACFTNYVGQYLIPQTLDQLMEPSDVVGNIRFSHPTLYVFPGGQGDAALFGINGFNMLVDGGFARKACFWDFARHLDRLDAVLVTRVNNSNVGGMSSVLRKKREMHVYPQIGHFFCNLVERRHSNSPDGDKDLDPLTLNLIDIGQEMMVDLRQINLRAHPCYRDPNPINLYHKVGHGTLDMYVLSPSKDSREVRDFLSKWHSADSKLFAGSHKKDSNNLTFPIQNLASICALLVWQPANPEDTITRILFPGSTPQHKIFEGFERLKHLEFLKHPVCSAKSLSPSTSLLALKDRPTIKQKLGLIEKETKKSFDTKREKRDLPESKLSKAAAEEIVSKPAPQSTPIIPIPKAQPPKIDVKSKKVVENKKIETESKKMEKDLKEMKKESTKKDIPKIDKDVETKKSEIIKIKSDTEKTSKEPKAKSEPKKKDTKDSKLGKISKIDMPPKPAAKLPDKKPKPVADKKDSAKASPPTPKKTMNGSATKAEVASKPMPRPITKPTGKPLPSSMPAKSAKDANNRKVVEQKNIEIASAASAAAPASAKPTAKPKTSERKPISRRTKPVSPSKARVPGSPAKSTRSTPTTSVKSDKDGVIRKVKGGDRGTTDSSTVSTPSGIEIDSMTKLADKSLTEKSEDMSLDSIESKVLADLKEEREVVEEIEAVLQKAERIEEARKDDHLEGDDDITAEATDKKEDDMTEDDVTADIEEAPKKKTSRKASQELTEEEEYLIVEKEEIYIEDSAQSGEGEQKHVLDAVESEKVKPVEDIETAKEEDEAEVSEEKEKSDVPEKKLLRYDEEADKDKEGDEMSPGHKEQLKEEMKDIIASATEIVQKTEDKDDSGKKDSEDITKEPSSLSPDKFDSSEKKTTDTDPMKPEADQKDQQVAEKLEESQERISTLESGATTTAPTLPEDERIPLDDIKEVIDEKYVADEDKDKDTVEQVKESFVTPIPAEPKPDARSFQVRPALQGIQREIVKTPDEVADLPVHEEVDPKLYRMEDFEKTKYEKSSAPSTAQQQEPKEPPTPPVKEQKGVFSFFGKVADKFEKGMDKLTGKSRRDSEKDIDEKSSKSSSPKEAKPQEITVPSDVRIDEVHEEVVKVVKPTEMAETFEKSEPEVSKIKVAAITDTAAFLHREIEDLRKSSLPDEEIKDTLEAAITEQPEKKAESKPVDLSEPVFETCVLKGQQKDILSGTVVEVEEDVEDVEALLEEASKKFKTVKDSLRDSLESLEEKIVEEEMMRAQLAAASKDVVKDTLSEVVEKLEEIKPHMEEAEPSEIKESDKVKFEIPEAEDHEDEKDVTEVTKDFKEAVRDVGEVLAGSAGILIEEKPKDVIEIVKIVAEELKKADFLSHDVLFDKDDVKKPEDKISDDDSKTVKSVIEEIIPKKVGVTEELPPQEEIEELLESGITAKPLASYKPADTSEIEEEPCVKTITSKEFDAKSPVRDLAADKIDAMKICSDLMDEEPAPSRKKRSIHDEDQTKEDVMEAGIEAVCIKAKAKEPPTKDVDETHEIEGSDIVFDRKLSPDKAHLVMVTPDSVPTSPKFPATKIHTEEEIDETPELPSDIKNELENKEEPLEKIIENLVFTKKTKITIEIVEYITVIRKIPREKVIYIIEEIIIKKGVPRDSVVADLDLLKPDTASGEKRAEIEEYIDREYITKNKRITIDIVEEISIKKFVTKRIVIEIIEEIIVKKRISRDAILDISETEIARLRGHRKESMVEEDAMPEISEAIDEHVDEIPETDLSADVHSEIEKYIVDEIISKGKKITLHIIDEISIAKRVPKRLFIEIIEEIIIKRKIPRSSILDISEKELSDLIMAEKEDMDQDEVVPETEEEEEPDQISVSPETRQQIEKHIIDEYMNKIRNITPYIFDEMCVQNKVSRRTLIQIIEDLVVKLKVPRSSILNISDIELEEMLAAEKEEDEKESVAAASDDEDKKHIEPETEEYEIPTAEKIAEIYSIIGEYISKSKKITPYIYEDICIRYKIPRRILMESIEEVFLESQKIRKCSFSDIIDDELSELLYPGAGSEEGELDVRPIAEQDVALEDGEDKLVDGFVSIAGEDIASTTVISPLKTVGLAEQALKESEKDVSDDFEAVEQEYKIHDTSITTAKELAASVAITDEGKISDDIEEALEDDVSDVVEADEKTIGSVAPITVATVTAEKKSEDISETSEIVDTTEKYLIEAQEKAQAQKPAPETPSDKIIDYTHEAKLKLIQDTEVPEEEVIRRKDSVVLLDHQKAVSEKEITSQEGLTAVQAIEKTDQVQTDAGVSMVVDKPGTPELDEEIREIKEQVSGSKSPVIEEKSDIMRAKRSVDDEIQQRKYSMSSQEPVEAVKMSDEITDDDETAVPTSQMPVTASREDGGQEKEVSTTGGIIAATKTPDDSLKSSPVKTTPDQDSLLLDKESLPTGTSTPEKDSISGKTTPGTKDGDKITPEDSLDKSLSVTRDLQGLEDSLDKSEPTKLKETEKLKSPTAMEEEIMPSKLDVAAEKSDETLKAIIHEKESDVYPILDDKSASEIVDTTEKYLIEAQEKAQAQKPTPITPSDKLVDDISEAKLKHEQELKASSTPQEDATGRKDSIVSQDYQKDDLDKEVSSQEIVTGVPAIETSDQLQKDAVIVSGVGKPSTAELEEEPRESEEQKSEGKGSVIEDKDDITRVKRSIDDVSQQRKDSLTSQEHVEAVSTEKESSETKKISAEIIETAVLADTVKVSEKTDKLEKDSGDGTDVVKPSAVELDEEPREGKEPESEGKSPVIEDKIDTTLVKSSIDDVSQQRKDSLIIQEPVEAVKKISDKTIDVDETAVPTSTVSRMLVTASSEDGGQEKEICPTGSITFTATKTPDDSLKSSPVKSTPDQDSLLLDKESLRTGASTPEKDSISDKSTPGTKDGDKVTPEDSLDKSLSVTRDLQDLEDSLEKSDPIKLKEAEKPSTGLLVEKEQSSTSPVEPTVKAEVVSKILQTTESSEQSVEKSVEIKLISETEKPGSISVEAIKKPDDIEISAKSKESSPSPADESKVLTEAAKKTQEAELSVKSTEPGSSPVEESKVFTQIVQPSLTLTDDLLKTLSAKSTTDQDSVHLDKESSRTSSSPEKDIVSDKSTPEAKDDDRITPKDSLDKSPAQTEELKETEKTKSQQLPSIAGDVHSQTDTSETELKSRSPSITSEKHDGKESTIPSKASSIVGDHITEKDLKELVDESKASSEVTEAIDDIASIDRSKPSSIAGDIHSQKDALEAEEKSRSPSVASEKYEGKESAVPSKASSIADDHVTEKDSIQLVDEPKVSDELTEAIIETVSVDRSKTPSIAGDIHSQKDAVESDVKSRSPSIVSKEHEDKVSAVSSKASSIAGDHIVEKDSKELVDDTASIDRSKSPSIVSDIHSQKGSLEAEEKSRSPSIASEKHEGKESAVPSKASSIAGDHITEKDLKELVDETVSVGQSKSPSIAGDIHSQKDAAESEEKSRSPSVVGEKPEDKETAVSSKASSIAGDHAIEKDSKELVDETASIDRSKSPSIAGDVHSQKDALEVEEKSRSPSIASDKPEGKESGIPSKGSSIAGDHITEKDLKELVDETASAEQSKSPSTAGDKHSQKDVVESKEKSRSPSIVSDKHEDKDSNVPSKASSIADDHVIEKDSKELVDETASVYRSKSPSIAGDIHSQKDVLEVEEKSRSPSILSEKHEGKESAVPSKASSIAGDHVVEEDLKQIVDETVSVDRSKSPSIAGDIHKDTVESQEKSRSPSIVSEKHEDKESGVPPKTSSMAGDHITEKDSKELFDDAASVDRSKSPSIAGDIHSQKDSLEVEEKSRSPSIASEKHEGKESAVPSKASSIAGDHVIEKDSKELVEETVSIDRSKSPSIAGDIQSQKESLEVEEKSLSPSIDSEKHEGKESAVPSKTSSIAGDHITEKDLKELVDDTASVDRSKSPSIAGDIQSQKASLEVEEKSRSPSIASEKHEGKESAVPSKASSTAGDHIIEKDSKEVVDKTVSVDRSKSPSIAGDVQSQKDSLEVEEKSLSPSIESEKHEGKESAIPSKTFSIAGDHITEKDLKELIDDTASVDRSKSPSIAGDIQSQKASLEVDEKSRSPSIASEKHEGKESAVPSKASSIAGDHVIEKDSKELVDETVSVNRSKSPSIAGDIQSQKDFLEVEEKSRSPSMDSEKHESKESAVSSKTSSIAGDHVIEKDSKELVDETATVDRSKSPSIAGDIHSQKDALEVEEKSRSPSIASEKHEGKESVVPSKASSTAGDHIMDKDSKELVDDTTSVDRSKSPSVAGDIPGQKDVLETEEKSRSPSVASEKHEGQESAVSSRKSSIAGDIHSQKDVLETCEKSRSPSIVSEKHEAKEAAVPSTTSSIAGDIHSQKDALETDVKSRSPSIASEKHEAKESAVPSTTSSIAGDVHSQKDTLEASVQPRSPSIDDEKHEGKESDVTSRKSSIIGDVHSQKDDLDVDVKSRSPSIASEKHETKESDVPSRKSSIIGDVHSQKDALDLDVKSRSPSIASEKHETKESAVPVTTSSTAVDTHSQKDAPDTDVKSRSPSIASEKHEVKEDAVSSVISSTGGDVHSEKEASETDVKSRSPSIADDKHEGKESAAPSRKLSTAGDVHDEKDASEADVKSRSPSIASEKHETKESTVPSTTSSVAGDVHSQKDILEADIKSRSPSIDGEKHDSKESDVTSRKTSIIGHVHSQKDTLETDVKSRSPSIASEKHEIKESGVPSTTSSIASDIHSQKDALETDVKSRSPSIAGEKHEMKESDVPSRKSSIVDDVHSQKDALETDVKSRSPSIASEKHETKESALPSTTSSIAEDIIVEKDSKELVDDSKTPGGLHEKFDEGASVDRSKSPTITGDVHSQKDALDEKSRSSSIASEKPDALEPDLASRTPSDTGDKITETDLHELADGFEKHLKKSDDQLITVTPSSTAEDKHSEPSAIATAESDHKSTLPSGVHDIKSPSIVDEKHEEKEPTVKSRSPSIVGDKPEKDHSRSPSIADVKQEHAIGDHHSQLDDTKHLEKPGLSSSGEKTGEVALVDGSKSTSIAGEDHIDIDTVTTHDTSRKFSLVSEKHSEHDATELDKSRSPSITSVKSDEKLPTVRSRSASTAGDKHSENDETEIIEKSRSPSIVSEKPKEKFTSPSLEKEKPGDQEGDDTKEFMEKSRSPSITSETTDVKASVEISKSPDISEEKRSETEAAALIEKSGPSSIADVKDDGKESIDRLRSPSIASYDHESKETPDSILDVKQVEMDRTKSLEKVRSPSITDVKHDGREPIDLSKPSSLDVKISHSDLPDSKISTHDESLDHAKPVDQIEKTVISSSPPALERTSRSASIASVHDSKLDEKDAVQALQKLAETIADKSAEVKHVTKSPLDEMEHHDTPKDRSRSHSVFDAGDKTPLGRSRTASLFDDRVPESLRGESKTAFEEPRGTYSYDESDETKFTKDDLSRKSSLKDVPDDKKDSVSSGSRKSSVAKFEDAISKRSSVAIQEDIAGQFAEDYHTTADEISKVEDYIVNKYIIKKEKITSRVVEEIVMLYSMPKYMILELIEAIIMKKNVPRDFVVDYPKYDGTCDSVVTSKDDHVDVIDIPPAKRLDIESYIQEEFITKNKKISSDIIDDLVTRKSVSRHIIIIIIEEIITKRNIQSSHLLEDGILDESSKLSKSDSYEPVEQENRVFEQENLPSISTAFDTSSHPSISSSDIQTEQESGISEEKRVEVESYVMEECVKKGKKITVLVLEQIITKMSVPRSVLLDIIENIIVTRKMSRKTMVDDAIYDDVDKDTSKSPEILSTKDRTVEFSGKSTPDPKSSGYSTPETRQYDDKLTKELSSYSSDYESPFHKAFVGGMTEIRTTHITTLSGKSTPDFGTRGETPESLSDSMTSSSQTKADEKVPSVKETLHTSAHELSDTVELASSISTVGVAMTTTTTTESSALSSVLEQKDYGVSVASEKVAGEQAFSDDLSKRMKRDTVTIESKSQLGDVPDMTKIVPQDSFEEKQQSIETTKIIRKEVISEDDPEVITRVIRREVIDDEEEEEPEIITRVIRREVIGDEEEEEEKPEVITRIIRREVIGDDEQEEPEVITRVIRREVMADEEEPEVITRVIRREIIDRDDDEGSPDTFETITTRTTKTIVTEDMAHHDKSEIQTTSEKITSESGPTYVTRMATQDSLSGGPISADVKRTITTVTTVTEPDGKVTTKKDVQESTDTLEGDELLEKLIDSTKSDDSDTLTHAKSIESLKTEKIITETIKTVSGASASGIRGDFDSGKSTPDSALREEKCDTLSKSKLEKIVAETVDHPISPIIKDLISDERSFSGKSSSEVSKDQLGSLTGKSTPDIPVPTSGRSTPDKRADSRSSTATPEGFRSSETIRTTITTTRTMSEDGDIITTTKEITEATNEKGEVTILAEKTDVKVEDRVLTKDIGESSPKSDHSSMHSRAGTHVWGSGDDRHTYSDDEVPGSPLSTTSQVGYSPQSTYHFGDQSFGKDSSHKSIEFSEADMSSSFYGELPDLPPRVTTLKSAYLESESSETSRTGEHATAEGDFSFKKFTVEKEIALGISKHSDPKRYVDDAEEALTSESKEMRDRDEHSSTAASGYTNGNLTKPSSSTLSDETKDSKDDSKRDPLADWGTPLGLPSPKPPRKFNLRTTARPTNSADISPDSLNFDAINDWGEPLRLPSPAPVADEASNKGTPVTPKKERKQPKKVISENLKNKKRSESPSKNEKKTKDAKNKVQPVYMDLTYVPHHGNSYYTSLEFFKRVRARYYVFSGTEPSREVYDALLDAKKTWEDKDLEVTMIPTYDTDTLGYWVADNEEALAANHIDLSPSASRCTINLQDHETSCSAYRLEF